MTEESSNVVSLQERRLGRTVLRTYRTTLDIADIMPNEPQRRAGPKEDEELQRQIEANKGLAEPLLVEPHPELAGKYRIIDGERRWNNSCLLIERGQDRYRQVPVEVTDRSLSDSERLQTWVYIQRQRKQWEAEKEMVAYRLVDLMGRASAANVLEITLRELTKRVETYKLSERFTGPRDQSAALTWARELMGVSKKLLTENVIDAVVRKVNQKRITNSKDLRKLRAILPDPVARAHFLTEAGDLESAQIRLRPQRKAADESDDLLSKLAAATEAMRAVPWTALDKLRANPAAMKTIEDAERLLRQLRKYLRL